MTALAKTSLFALVAALTVALLATMTKAHSWADCVDWRFNDPKKPGWSNRDGKCFAYARKFPYKSGTKFGGRDSDNNPHRQYRQDPKDFTSCSDGKKGLTVGADESRQNPVSKSYGGNFGPMAVAKAGDTMCVRWPGKSHNGKDQRESGVFINMPPSITTKDPKQSDLMKMTIAHLSFKNCSTVKDEQTPCGGCFKIPANRKPGTYTIQWRWELKIDEWYTSCWDVKVKAAGGAKKKDTVESLSVPTDNADNSNSTIFSAIY
ncbi:hypothetical protein KI688_006461 [Linnemannia hyalina]|uniref:Secreted protein n=1 Tax=Linnemannia hyalina TaxID=64524 RepID=A0A9P7XLI4_9FUNG|nr:hypothetical protein KI688_006461 [Linnemannia hyalina]